MLNSNPENFLKTMFTKMGYRFADFSELEGQVLWSMNVEGPVLSFGTNRDTFYLECDNGELLPIVEGDVRQMLHSPITRARSFGTSFILETQSSRVSFRFLKDPSDNLIFWMKADQE